MVCKNLESSLGAGLNSGKADRGTREHGDIASTQSPSSVGGVENDLDLIALGMQRSYHFPIFSEKFLQVIASRLRNRWCALIDTHPEYKSMWKTI